MAIVDMNETPPESPGGDHFDTAEKLTNATSPITQTTLKKIGLYNTPNYPLDIEENRPMQQAQLPTRHRRKAAYTTRPITHTT